MFSISRHFKHDYLKETDIVYSYNKLLNTFKSINYFVAVSDAVKYFKNTSTPVHSWLDHSLEEGSGQESVK